MSGEMWVAIAAISVAVINMIRGFFERPLKKDIREIKESLRYRKEENTISLDASEAAIDAAISLGANGKCKDAKVRIQKYRRECIENRT